ncbi:MAG: metallophosphoesterase [Sphingomonadaceae bacterium]|nr:metallophosphoesterase [Sphingomonadaceae bacterium]
MRLLLRSAAVLMAALLLLCGYGYSEAVRAPRVVRYRVVTPMWTEPPIRIALVSDTHVIGPDMPPERLRAVVAQVNALKPDLILLAGDYVSRRVVSTRLYGAADAIEPFAGLRAPLGVYAVYGNHDFRDVPQRDVAGAFARAHVPLIRNRAVRVGGFWIAGLDDPEGGYRDPADALRAVPPGAPVLFLVHNPDLWARTPGRVAITFAGHTHGGQVVLPLIGPGPMPVRHREWARGVFTRGDQRLVVTSGVGASGFPVRLGVPPEFALIELSGRPQAGVPPPGMSDRVTDRR